MSSFSTCPMVETRYKVYTRFFIVVTPYVKLKQRYCAHTRLFELVAASTVPLF
jgi:hypothetical protein